MNTIQFAVCKAVTEYLVGWVISSFVIKPRIVKESSPVCTQIDLTWIVKDYAEAYTNNAIPDCDVKKHF